MKKIFSLLFLFLITIFLYSGGKQVFLSIKNSMRGPQEENIIEGDMNIAVAEKEKEKDDTAEGIYVPYYWKVGIPADGNDFLKGYLPSLSQFDSETKTRNAILYPGAKESKQLARDDISSILSSENTIYVKGIVNMNENFAWKEDSCSSVYSEEFGKTLFFCDFWLNWNSFNPENNHFSLTECRINNIDGYCVFLDYLQEFYNWKKSLDTRCIGDNNSDLKCEFASYKEAILKN